MRAARAFIVFFIIILSARAGFSQPWYFNEIYNPNGTFAGATSIISIENGYIGCGMTGDSVSDYFYNAHTFLLDENGELVHWNNFGEYGYDYYPGGYYGSLIVVQDNSYASFGTRHNLYTNLSDGLFYKFNALGDTIFTRIFASDSYNNFIGRTCITNSDNGFALLGEVQNFSGYSDAVLIKTDSAANEIWRRQFGTEIDDWAINIAQTPDSGYILGTWAYIPVQIVTADPIVIKTDSQGNFEWSLNLGGPYGDDKAMVCNTQDSCIMVLTAYADSMWSYEYAYTKINLVKIDLQGNIIWNKKYGTSKPVNFISNIISLDNGDFMACGYTKDLGYVFRISWMFQFNGNGDSLWYREYFYYMDTRSEEAENYLYDVSSTKDSGFIATGQAYSLSPTNYLPKMWVIKVDSVGCEIPNCWVGIEENDGMETGGQGDQEMMGGLEIWPNPAGGIVDCRWPMVDFRGDCLLVIYDMFGREKMNISVPENEREIQLDVGNFPRGLYLVVVRNESYIIGSSKLVISRW